MLPCELLCFLGCVGDWKSENENKEEHGFGGWVVVQLAVKRKKGPDQVALIDECEQGKLAKNQVGIDIPSRPSDSLLFVLVVCRFTVPGVKVMPCDTAC